jgi:hypothetical protein
MRPSPNDSNSSPLGRQQRLAADRLDSPTVLPLLVALRKELKDEFESDAVPTSADELVQWCFDLRDPGQIQRIFYCVRRALSIAKKGLQSAPASIRDVEQAAVAMYALEACLLVDSKAHEDAAIDRGGSTYVVQAPRSENVICAIIATALFGGELHLIPTGEAGTPRAQFVFEVDGRPADGEKGETNFERAAYVAILRNHANEVDASVDSGPLTPDQRDALESRIGSIQKKESASFALLVPIGTSTHVVDGFAGQYRVPIMVPDTSATHRLLGMSAGRLLAEIREFWRELDATHGFTKDSSNTSGTTSHQGEPSMGDARQGINIHNTGNGQVVVSTGLGSSAQAGSGNMALHTQYESAALADVRSLLEQLRSAIAELPSEKAREKLGEHLAVAEAAAAGAKPDPGAIKSALELIKPAADVLEGGAKIASLCNKVYNLVAPMLGLPPSPLP